MYPAFVTSRCSPGGELSAQADEPATVKCIQCNERCCSEDGAESAGSPVLDSQKSDCSIQCTQVGLLLVGGSVQFSCIDMSPQLVILAYYAGCVNLAIATTPLCASAAHCVGIAVDQTTMLETERKS